MSATKQRKSACSSCPWIVDGDRTCHFDPSVLKKTVVDAMNSGSIHPCHSGGEFMCSGYLAFAEKNLPAGVDSLQMVRISSRLGMFDYNLVNEELNVFSSVKAMLSDHKKRMSSIFGSKLARKK
jgi:Family of unknown function (DUF6283)